MGFAVALVVFTATVSLAADSPKKLRLAYAGWEIGTAVAYIGVDAGLFKQHGLEVDELPIRDTLTAGVQSLVRRRFADRFRQSARRTAAAG